MTVASKLSILLGLMVLIGNSSCNKPKECKASIFVIDEEGRPISGANVRLYSDLVSGQTQLPSKIDENKITNKTGRLDFTQPLPVILNLTIDYPGYSMTEGNVMNVKFIESNTMFVTVEMKQ